MNKIKYLNASGKVMLMLFCMSLSFTVLYATQLFTSYNDKILPALIIVSSVAIASGASLMREIKIVKRENVLIRKMLDNLKPELIPHQISYDDDSVFEVLEGSNVLFIKDIDKADLSHFQFAFKLDDKYFIINKYGCFETSKKELEDSVEWDDPVLKYNIDKLMFEAYEKHCLDTKQQNPYLHTDCESIVKFAEGELVLIFLNQSYSVHSRKLAFNVSDTEAEDVLNKRIKLSDIYNKYLTETFTPSP